MTTEDPRVLRSRAAILAAAFRGFAAHGFPGCSLEDVAEDAGVAKRTIYNLYGDKRSLFEAMLAQAVATAEAYSDRLDAEVLHDQEVALEDRLVAVAVDLARSIFGGQVVALRRLLISEAQRFPDLAAEYYRRAPGRVMDRFAAAMGRLHADGELDAPDTRAAAEHFAFLAIGASLDQALFEPAPDLDAALARARTGAAAFARAYRTHPT